MDDNAADPASHPSYDSIETNRAQQKASPFSKNTENQREGGDYHEYVDCEYVDAGTDSLQTFLHLVKGYIGPGCLALPWAFSILGIGWGIAAVLIVGALTSYNALVLVHLKNSECRSHRASYSDIGEAGYGLGFRSFVDVSVISIQLAVCTVFLTLVGENVSAVLLQYFEPEDGSFFYYVVSRRGVMTFVALPSALGLSAIPNLTILATATAIATVLLFLTFTIMGVIIALNWDVEATHVDHEFSEVILAVAAIMYSWEGDQLILPVETAMENPGRFQYVFLGAMTTVAVVFTLFATACSVSFGDVDNGSVTAFLMHHADAYSGAGLVYAANFAASLSILLTYPLQLFPATVITGQIVARRRAQQALPDKDVVVPPATRPYSGLEGDSFPLRACLVLSTYALAMWIPHVQEMISLAGAVSGAATSLIIPPLLQIRFAEMRAIRILSFTLLVIGVLFGIFGTLSAVEEIIENNAAGRSS
eukprot:CAMPEP_0194279624 /NCGR_PEP_ID=MMETSP0169-20130528/14032_1 /TAXON_ID=218684 /ORGANISM="Corethron pennatum, Strain L29A3" /LENGTH=477 /DNA_ID=CAMNT_0039024071 /DNA_START=24 /DNA_END=1457 /DNA_ORIENTATION=-